MTNVAGETPAGATDSGAALDEAVMESLSGGDRKTQPDLLKETQASSARLASALRRLRIEKRIMPTSLNGKRAFQETAAYQRARLESEAPAAGTIGEPQDAS